MNRLLPLTVVLLAAGCAPWRLWGAFPVPHAPAPAPAAVEVPQASSERRAAALFYSDLGQDAIDVSAYPAERRRGYEVYARACSRCHSLARSINAPDVSRGWWEFYMTSMRVRAKFRGEPLTKPEIRAVLDFLVYDSNERKVAHAAEFETIKVELKRRFEAALDERLENLQKQSQPRILR